MFLFACDFGQRLPLKLCDSSDAWNEVVGLGLGNTPKKETVEFRRANDVDEVGV